MKRLLCLAASAALLCACATPPPPPPPLPPPPPPPAMLSQVSLDCAMGAAEADLFEIESGRLAAGMGSHPDVRAYGQMLVDDHTRASADLMAVINGAGIVPPPPPVLSPARAQQLDMLRASGPNFDVVFLQSQIMAHEEGLALHRACSDSAGPPTAAVHASLVPVIQAHLDRARMLADMVRMSMGERG